MSPEEAASAFDRLTNPDFLPGHYKQLKVRPAPPCPAFSTTVQLENEQKRKGIESQTSEQRAREQQNANRKFHWNPFTKLVAATTRHDSE